MLPTELLQMVFRRLGAVDFNAARHACRSWYLASLDADLLVEHLQRGGWWTAASAQLFQGPDGPSARGLSSFLARECALAGDWTGCGKSDSGSARCESPLTECADVTFSAISKASDSAGCAPVCTTSLCGRYFLLASGSEIYTYQIHGEDLRLINHTSCEKRVLALAIDVSPERFAIAALLDGRIGVYIDLVGSAPSQDAASP